MSALPDPSAVVARVHAALADLATEPCNIREQFGFSPEIWRRGLAAEAEAWTSPALSELLATLAPSELARAPRHLLVVAARTLPVSALRQCALGLALGATVHLKAASDRALLGDVLARSLGLIAEPWPSHDTATLERTVAAMDTVVVLGGDAAVATFRAHLRPDQTLAPHGHRVSAAWFSESPSDQQLIEFADDFIMWDQSGCLAPRVVWTAEPPAALLPRLARAITAREQALPGVISPAHASSRSAQRPTETLALMAGGQSLRTPASLLVTHPEPSFRASDAPRTLWLLPADELAFSRVIPVLSTVAVVGSLPGPVPATLRVCAPGAMQRPPLAWHHDGLDPLRSLLRPD